MYVPSGGVCLTVYSEPTVLKTIFSEEFHILHFILFLIQIVSAFYLYSNFFLIVLQYKLKCIKSKT